MDAAWEAGITTFDTATPTAAVRSESFIGSWLRSKGPEVRDRIVLTTKTFNPMSDGADHGLARERIRRQLDGSLERLGVESVRSTSRTPWMRRCRWRRRSDLRRSRHGGKIRAYGGSNVDAAWIEEALRHGRPDWVQNSYSLLDRDVEDGVLESCRREGLGFTPFSPLAGGWLTWKYSGVRRRPRDPA
jgi:aryl-alcohol dehydrogenase-like predicted oxidoreductase